MTVSFTLDDLETSAEGARPYRVHEDTRLPAIHLPVSIMAAGAVNTSVADLANWMRLHLGKGEFNGERILPATLIDALHAPRVLYHNQPVFGEFGAAHYGRRQHRWCGGAALLQLLVGALKQVRIEPRFPVPELSR